MYATASYESSIKIYITLNSGVKAQELGKYGWIHPKDSDHCRSAYNLGEAFSRGVGVHY